MSSTSASSTSTLPEPVVLPATTVGDATGILSSDEVSAFVREQLDAYPVDGRSVCILVPDGTRTVCSGTTSPRMRWPAEPRG